ncbi:MAG: galactokinase [Propionibacteriales bacterium]|nr:galactokinase [Propionibacteriales bacterium]
MTTDSGSWVAPGRVNLIGEHTDYNDGFVLPLAIPLQATARVSRRDDRTVRARSRQRRAERREFTVDTEPGDVTGWASYVAGVFWAFRQAGHQVPGADIAVNSTVPGGAGLSSSAALECVVALALSDLAGLDLAPDELARLAQRAENDYVGMPCGVMDQMASMRGAEGQLVFLDTRSGHTEHVPFDLAAAGLALLVVDTRAPHRLVKGEYAERRADCEQAAKLLGVPALRDAELGDLTPDRLPDRLLRRARHVVTENARVLRVVEQLRAGTDPRAIGPELNASHDSLREDFEVTVPELDVAVATAVDAGAHGARMTGGGFGGSIIALVDDHAVEAVAAAVAAEFDRRGFTAPRHFTATAARGAHRLAT